MNIIMHHWVNIILAISFLIPGVSWSHATAKTTIESTTTYVPMVMNQPQGMVFIAEGEFWMGCPWAHGDCNFGSSLVHTVWLSAYFIDRYETTNAEYAKCVAAGACQPPAAFSSHSRASYYDNPSYANYPVFHITWDDSQDYCVWQGKRLPTEAEWEKAAQGVLNPSDNRYPWGDEAPVCDLGASNGAHSSDCSPADSVEVGSFGPSSIGLFDMAGNVYEWVYDWYDLSYYSNSPYYNPQGPETGTDKVIRGGSWNYMTLGLRVYDRNFSDPNTALGNHDAGFRCVLIP